MWPCDPVHAEQLALVANYCSEFGPAPHSEALSVIVGCTISRGYSAPVCVENAAVLSWACRMWRSGGRGSGVRDPRAQRPFLEQDIYRAHSAVAACGCVGRLLLLNNFVLVILVICAAIWASLCTIEAMGHRQAWNETLPAWCIAIGMWIPTPWPCLGCQRRSSHYIRNIIVA